MFFLGIFIGGIIAFLILYFNFEFRKMIYMVILLALYHLFLKYLFFNFEEERNKILNELSYLSSVNMFNSKFDYLNEFWKRNDMLFKQVYLFICIFFFVPFISRKTIFSFLFFKGLIYNLIPFAGIINCALLLNKAI